MKIQLIVSVMAMSFAFVDRAYAGVSRAQMENLANRLRTACVRKVKADMALVEGIRNGQFTEGNDALKCYTKCIMVLMKTYRNNKTDLDTVIKQIQIMASDDVADKLVSAAKQCYSEVEQMADMCEYTWRYTICTYDKDPKNFFFP